MQKAQQVGVRRKPFGKDGMRGGGVRLFREGDSSVQKEQKRYDRVGSVAFHAGAAGRGAEEDFIVSAQERFFKSMRNNNSCDSLQIENIA